MFKQDLDFQTFQHLSRKFIEKAQVARECCTSFLGLASFALEVPHTFPGGVQQDEFDRARLGPGLNKLPEADGFRCRCVSPPRAPPCALLQRGSAAAT